MVVALALAVAGCGGGHAAERPKPPPSLGTTFVTGHPAAGIAVERRGRVELVGLDGDVVARIPGVGLAFAPDRDGVVLSQRGARWLFRPGSGRFVRLPGLHLPRARVGCREASHRGALTLFLCAPPSREPGSLPSAKTIELRRGTGRRIVLARPPFPAPSPDTGPIGHWESARVSPDGRTVLAQWSAECEVPIAFILPVAGGALRPVAGTLHDPVDSIALGWSPEGSAVVSLPSLGCGGGYDGPGVYLVSTAAKPLRAIVKGRDIRGAQLWTS
jgi:hypothetical protein